MSCWSMSILNKSEHPSASLHVSMDSIVSYYYHLWFVSAAVAKFCLSEMLVSIS